MQLAPSFVVAYAPAVSQLVLEFAALPLLSLATLRFKSV